MLSYDDIKAMRKGKEAEVQEQAGRKLDSMVEAEEQAVAQQGAEVDAAHQQAQMADEEMANSVMQEAQAKLDELSNSDTPDEDFAQLSPDLQNAVMQLMEGGAPEEEGMAPEAPMPMA